MKTLPRWLHWPDRKGEVDEAGVESPVTGYQVVMTDEPAVYLCPGCGRPVEPGEDYVVALEYDDEPGFCLHEMRSDSPVGAEQRFHVEHFRGRLGDHVYALVDRARPTEPASSSRPSIRRCEAL